ncbi:arsenic resistance N-acetyltransferase ArsN2 [Consotaella aegiceratis]|uniref:arsenic resistance N-acetyltransferase ArsN2 n=1 Tax=Consotaella aegiceratis TaxID=3097961 RepID=UPI002F3E712D
MNLTATPVVPDAALVTLLAAEGLPTEDVHDAGRIFLRFTDETGEVVGVGGYEPLGENALLRSVVVVANHRGGGLGRRIIEALLRRAASDGVRDAYALTTDRKSFLARLGFQPIARTAAPTTVLETRQAKTLCAASAILWHRTVEA